MQAMLAADCIDQTSLFRVTHFIPFLQTPQSAMEKEGEISIRRHLQKQTWNVCAATTN